MGKVQREIPIFDGPLIETHCHLDYLKELPLEEILAKSRDKKVEKMVTISVEPKNLSVVRQLAKAHAPVFCTQGIHPHEAKQWNDEVDREICEFASKARDYKIVAIGEIGLDFHYDHSPREKQHEVFCRQLEIAAEFDLPVVIHTRDADRETGQVLADLAPSLKKKGVVHSFTSGPELAEKALELGFFLGLNGIITFKNAENVRDIVRLCPLERILLETDSPFLTPDPYRGRENAPYYLPLVAEKIAEIKQVEVEQVLAQTTSNAQKLFDF